MDTERESPPLQAAIEMIPESDPVQQDDGFSEEMLNLPDVQTTPVPAAVSAKKSAPRRKIVVRSEVKESGDDDLEIVRDDLSVAARLPVGRIKNIMKMDPQARNMAADSVYLMCTATELFIEQVAKQSWFFTEAASRKTMSGNDVHLAVDSQDNLRFLEDMLP